MSANARRRLQTAFDRGDVPYVHNDMVYIGRGLPPVKLRAQSGQITNAGNAYQELLAARGNPRPHENLKLFSHEATVIHRGRGEYAQTRGGDTRLLRTFQPNGEHRYTRHGREFFEEARNFIVHLPVVTRWRRKDGSYSEGYTHQANGQRETIPLSLEQMQEAGLHLNFPELANLGRRGDPAELRRAVIEYLQHLDRDPRNRDEETGELIVGHGSTEIFTVDPEAIGNWSGWSFDEEVLDERTHRTEVFLNRPLGAAPTAPDDMWNKEGLHKEAWRDYRSEGKNCVAQQLAICLAEGKTKLTIAEIERHLDDLLEELYPGSNPAPEADCSHLRKMAEAWQRYFKRGRIHSIEWLRRTVRRGHFGRDTPFWGSDFNAVLAECGDYEGFFSRFGFRCADGLVSFSPEPELSAEEREDLEEHGGFPGRSRTRTRAGVRWA